MLNDYANYESSVATHPNYYIGSLCEIRLERNLLRVIYYTKKYIT